MVQSSGGIGQIGGGRDQRGSERGQRGSGRGKKNANTNEKHIQNDEQLVLVKTKGRQLRELRDEEEYDRKHDYFHPSNWTEEESYDQEPFNINVSTINANVHTQESVTANLNDMSEIRFRLGDFEAEDNHMSIGVGIAHLGKIVVAPSAAVGLSEDKGKTITEPSAKASTETKAKKK
uniref:Uncharacterized protein n=1 Tax=Tanacetum cinerariifolium TaxID=118510 RepID=A0A6L2N7H4_TANCI|nr:hypothetical protein [Tanacetum cinerariifolium]